MKYWIIPFLYLCLGSCSSSQDADLSQTEDQSMRDIKILQSVDVDSVVADFPVGFAALAANGHQFIAYYNKHRELSIAARKRSEATWTYHILPTKVGWDSHNRISMAIDRDGCIHLSGNMHNVPLIYFKTDKPYDISSFSKVFPMVSAEDEGRSTYPKFVKNAKGDLIFSYRKGGSGNGITIANIYDEQTKTFRRLTDEPLFDGLGLMSAYQRGPILGPDNVFHLMWFWRDTPGCETNHDLSYARSPDLVNWETVIGEKVKLPIIPSHHQFTVDPIPAGGGAINGGATLFFDSNQQAMIAYMKYDNAGKSQIFLASEQDDQWQIKQLSDWDYRWNFSGPGSIDFHIRLHDCHIRPDGRIVIGYTHIKRGRGELIVDPNSLALIEDRPVTLSNISAYPSDLLASTSGIDSATVRWLKLPADNNSHSYDALRWETMGKRRFYKPREKQVKPSIMTLYTFERKKEILKK